MIVLELGFRSRWHTYPPNVEWPKADLLSDLLTVKPCTMDSLSGASMPAISYDDWHSTLPTSSGSLVRVALDSTTKIAACSSDSIQLSSRQLQTSTTMLLWQARYFRS